MINISTNKRKWIIYLVGLGITILLLFPIFTNKKTSNKNENVWIKISPQSVKKTLDLSGVLGIAQKQIISAPFDAAIDSLNVKEGQNVNMGDVLLTLDSTQVDIQLRDSLSEKIKNKIELDVMNNWINSSDVSKARRNVNNSEYAIKNMAARLKEARELYEEGIIARVEVDELEQQFRQQKMDYLSAEDELDSVIKKGQGEFKKMADLAYQNSSEKYESLVKLSENKVIKSPSSGVVVKPTEDDVIKSVSVQKGMYVSKGNPLLEIINPKEFNVTAKVDETDVNFFKKGQAVVVTGDAFPKKELSGVVENISTQSNKSDNPGSGVYYDVIILIVSNEDKETDGIHPGMTAKVSIVTVSNELAYIVPVSAVHQDEDKFWINYKMNEEDSAHKIYVYPGEIYPEGIELTGVNSGYVEVDNSHEK